MGAERDHLGALLRASGIQRSAEEVLELIAAVRAAPEAHDPDAWLDLVAPPEAEWLRERLRALRGAPAEDVVEPPVAERLARFRDELGRRDLHGFLLPLTDEHGSEYLPRASCRLSWLTGFTGSTAFLVVLEERATVFVDGRYTLQAAAELDPALYEVAHLVEQPPHRWLARHLSGGRRIGYDAKLHRPGEVERFTKAVEQGGGELVALGDNPADAVWTTRPPMPVAPVVRIADTYAGEASGDKRRRIGRDVGRAGADVLVVTAPDSVAWLLNIRGGDVPFNPLALSFALLHADGAAELFIDRRKLGPGQSLGNGVAINPIDRFEEALGQLGAAGRPVLVDPTTTNAAIFARLRSAGARIVEDKDPIVGAKARKNPVELEGARNAQRRDGAAVTRVLAWLERAALDGRLTELGAAERLLQERARDPLFRGESFPAISGAGPNGAIVHYRVTPGSDRTLEPGSLYLIDSGGQYPDATTDVTRTVAIGEPDEAMRRDFTLVLKGHIRIARAVFPTGTSGGQIDALARQALWAAGLDYDHGTGHGVGAYLCVHEGPARISKRGGDVALEPGMILSNEPGCYRTGAYGIRIENLVAVTARPTPPGGERDLLGFETLTRVPLDRRLIRADLLDADELAWLNNYHARVRADLLDLVGGETRVWLLDATRPL